MSLSLPTQLAPPSWPLLKNVYVCARVCESQSDTEEKKSARVALITTSINGENFKNQSCRLLEKSSLVFQISFDNYIYSNTSSLTSPVTNDDGA
jgi:hypothetical protein